LGVPSIRLALIVPEKAFNQLIYLVLFSEFVWHDHQKMVNNPSKLVIYDTEEDETKRTKKINIVCLLFKVFS